MFFFLFLLSILMKLNIRLIIFNLMLLALKLLFSNHSILIIICNSFLR